MPRSGQRIRSVLMAVLGIGAMGGQCLWAVEIWNGPPITFTDPDGGDPTQAANQDRITANVWITRAAGSGQGGIYNARLETGYQHSLSPVGTEWAYGKIANYDSLIYKNWEDWFGGAPGGGPPSTVGRDAVLHILPGDIYIGIQFTSWGTGHQGLSGFSYVRSTQFVPEPSSIGMILAGLMAIRGIQFYRRRGCET